MRVLIACEFSGRVRTEFYLRGHNAWSCDLTEADDQDDDMCGIHHVGDVRSILNRGWDLMIAHPPCTYLATSGARWFKHRQKEQAEALEFVRLLMGAPIPRIAIENPVSVISSRIRKPDQIVQPWWFGDPYTKSTCLWLKGLPPLKPTNIVYPYEGSRMGKMAPSPTRGKERSITPLGMALAMAAQWGDL